MVYLPKMRPRFAASTRSAVGLAGVYCVLTVLLPGPAHAQTEDIDEEVGLEVDVDTWVRVYDSNGDIVYPSHSGSGGCGATTPDNDYCHVAPAAGSPDWNVEFLSEPGTAGTDWVFWWFENGIPTSDFVTFELATSPSTEDVIRRYTYVSYHRYQSGASFYRPDDDAATPDVSFRVFSSETVKATPSRVTFPYDDYFEDELGLTYVMPYDFEYYCAESQACSNPTRSYFLSPVDEVPTTSQARFTFSAATDAVIDSGWNLTWADPGLILRFPTGRRLIVSGGSSLTTENVDFVAAPGATTGWGGIRFEPQSTGRIEGGSIQGVGDSENVGVAYAIDIRGVESFAPVTDPEIIDVEIFNDAYGDVVGVYVSGTNTFPWLHENTISGLSAGVVLNDQSRARLTRNIIAGNSGNGLTAGSQTLAYLSPHPTDGSAHLGNIFDNNTGHGIYASSDAALWFAYAPDPQQGFHAEGYNTATASGLTGIGATSGAVLYAGTPSYQRYNRFFDNTGLDAAGVGKNTRVYASCDWWDMSPPFRTSATDQAFLDDSHYVLDDPYDPSDPTPPCYAISGEGLTAGGAAARVATSPIAGFGDGSSPRRLLLAAVEAMAERPYVAFALLSRVLDEAPDSREATAALAEAAGLLARPNAPPGIHALLDAHAAGSRPALRAAAHRALIGVLRREGDLARALAHTDALVAPGAATEDALFGHVARVYLYANLNRWDEAAAALARVEALAAGAVEARLARWHLLDSPAAGLLGAAPAGLAAVLQTSVASASVGAAAYAMGPVIPNPTSGPATVPLVLASPSRVKLVVRDVLGRVVAVITDRSLDAGTHSLAIPGSLPPSVYVAHAVVEPEGEAPRTLTARFSVTQ